VIEASVIVPARDAETTLPRTLDCLAKQDLARDYEVIVVDDGSRDRTVELARAASGPVRVLEQDSEGPAQARNLGVAESSGTVLAFCDADVFPTPAWLREGIRALESADLVQGQVHADPEARPGPFDRTLWITYEVGLWETANLFMRRETFDRAGGFEEWIVPEIGKAMFEDTWLGWRVRRLGSTSRFCPEALAYHAVFPRGWRDYVDEHRRLRYFPAAVAKIPELRRHFLVGGLFVTTRRAAFDAATAGTVAALALRSPLPLLAGVPYARMLFERGRGHGLARPKIAAADIAADATGLAALIRGSVRYRSPVL
jgi:glycosyltransferase involved in cell wall biosynthesis